MENTRYFLFEQQASAESEKAATVGDSGWRVTTGGVTPKLIAFLEPVSPATP